MEKDREETNLGPDIPFELQEEPISAKKIPRKRFIGRRAASEKAAQKASHDEKNIEESGTVAVPRSARAPRVLNRVPPEILNDEDINDAISLLPPNYSFEIHKTIHRIRSSGSKKIALQFPEGLLLFATTISDILTRFCPGTETIIMGDVTYGACCIDDYTAKALGCDLLVHYGHSCLVPVDVTSIKTLYVFVTIGIDVEHLISTISRNFTPGKRIALVGTIQFNATLHSILPRLRNMGYDPILPRSTPLSAGEILGCTAPTMIATLPRAADTGTSDSKSPNEADIILYLGDGRFHLESILIASPTLRNHTYRYDPYTRRLTHETYAHAEMHSLRSHAITTARHTLTAPSSSPEPTTWALIHGTLGRQGNPHTVTLIQQHLARRNIPFITLLLSEIFPAKLASMSADIAVWVQVACPRLSIDWGYAFERPLLSPYEAMVALGVSDGTQWGVDGGNATGEGVANDAGRMGDGHDQPVGTYPMDFYEKSGLGRTRAPDFDRNLGATGLQVEAA